MSGRARTRAQVWGVKGPSAGASGSVTVCVQSVVSITVQGVCLLSTASALENRLYCEVNWQENRR